MSGVTESEVLRFFHASRAKVRKPDAARDRVRDAVMERARLEYEADRADYERGWG